MNSRAVRRPLVVVILLLVCLIAALILGPAILAQSGGQYDLSWSAIVGGGESEVAGGDLALGGAIGQPGAGTSGGGQYHLESGFWHCFPLGSPDCADAKVGPKIYIPVITNPNK